jgi:hypothetical protein
MVRRRKAPSRTMRPNIEQFKGKPELTGSIVSLSSLLSDIL